MSLTEKKKKWSKKKKRFTEYFCEASLQIQVTHFFLH